MGPYPPPTGEPDPVSGDTIVYVIVGDPIAQVGSPTLFNAAFRRLGLRAILIPAHVAAEGLDAFLRGLRQLRNLGGIIVTVPHKIAVLDHIDRLELSGRRVGAVNAIRCDGRDAWIGANFDGEGCIAGLRSAGHDVIGRTAFLAGAGGAGRAVAHAVADAGARSMRIYDPDATRLAQLRDNLRMHHPALDVEAGSSDPHGCDIVFNCTPLGMHPTDRLPFDPDRLAEDAILVELIFKPQVTRLAAAAAARGCAVVPGRRTLEGQIEPMLRFLNVQTRQGG